jgi:hypothetical protein
MYNVKVILFLTVFFLFSTGGCEKEELENEWFIAEVLGKGMDCGGTYLINLMKGDREKIFQILKMESDAWFPTYYALNLPNEFKIEELQVRIKFRRPTPDEDVFCTCMGPGFGHIWIKKIEELND